ncbi:MAG: hypothetical protein Q8K63_09120, partial [Acidimicrobiales bacterium]|nr:hypothetical protein [Acidimicrobiales bacterium]
ATQDAWSLRMSWLPSNDAATQEWAGLFSLVDGDANVLATGYWDSDTSTIVVTIGADTLTSPVLLFDAGDVVGAVVHFDTVGGLALTVHTAAGTATVTDPTIITPVSSAPIDALEFASAALSDTLWGDGAWGDSTWGDAFAPAGVVDEIVVFAGRLTTTQAQALVTQTTQLASVPADPRPVWYAAFDTDASPTGAVLATGRRVESTPDAAGFSRFIAALETVASSGDFAITQTDATAAFTAGLALTGDDATTQHAQFAAQSQQETRIR